MPVYQVGKSGQNQEYIISLKSTKRVKGSEVSITLSGSNSTFVFIHTLWIRVCNSWKVVSVVIKRSATQWHIIESVFSIHVHALKR